MAASKCPTTFFTAITKPHLLGLVEMVTLLLEPPMVVFMVARDGEKPRVTRRATTGSFSVGAWRRQVRFAVAAAEDEAGAVRIASAVSE